MRMTSGDKPLCALDDRRVSAMGVLMRDFNAVSLSTFDANVESIVTSGRVGGFGTVKRAACVMSMAVTHASGHELALLRFHNLH